MHTLTLQIDDSIYSNVLWFLHQLPSNKLRIVSDTVDEGFTAYKSFIKNEIDEIDSGNAIFFTTEQVEERLNKVIGRYENQS